jgi:hypothetical protein
MDAEFERLTPTLDPALAAKMLRLSAETFQGGFLVRRCWHTEEVAQLVALDHACRWILCLTSPLGQVFYSTKELRLEFINMLLAQHVAALNTPTIHVPASTTTLLSHVLSLVSATPSAMLHLLPSHEPVGDVPSASFRAPAMASLLPALLTVVERDPVEHLTLLLRSREGQAATLTGSSHQLTNATKASSTVQVAACKVLAMYVQLLLSEQDASGDSVGSLVADLMSSGQTVLRLAVAVLHQGTCTCLPQLHHAFNLSQCLIIVVFVLFAPLPRLSAQSTVCRPVTARNWLVACCTPCGSLRCIPSCLASSRHCARD